MGSIWPDVRLALRAWGSTPAVAVAVITSLALGIGANTTVFTLLSALFWNPLPVDHVDQLIAIYTLDTKSTTEFGNLLPLSYANLDDLRRQRGAVTGLAGYSAPLPLRVIDGPESYRAFGQLVTGNYFDLLGVKPAAGRFFAADEDRTPGDHPFVVIGHTMWQQRFAADPRVLGRVVRLNGHPFTIIGVAPAGFKGVTSLFGPDLWVPSMMARQILPKQYGDWLTDRSALSFSVTGRLAPATSIAQAEAVLKTAASALERAHPAENKGRSVAVRPLSEAVLMPGLRKAMMLGGGLLLTVVGLVLLIACSNVANLLFARATARRQEFAVRLALGASRTRLVRQSIVEALLVAVAAGAAGFAIGWLGRETLWSFRPATVADNFVKPLINLRVFLFTLAVSLLTVLVFGLAPALQASRVNAVDALKDDPRFGRARRMSRVARALVVGQVALSLVSLVVASLFLRATRRASTIDLGYETSRLAVASVNPGQAGYDREHAAQFYRDAVTRVSALPGVASASLASNMPLWASQYRRMHFDATAAGNPDDVILALMNIVDDDYFTTIAVPVARGRVFTAADREGGDPAIIINETVAAKYWRGSDPVGRRVRIEGETAPRTIVGVVKTTKYQTVGEAPQLGVYLPLRQSQPDAMVIYVRARDSVSRLLPTMERALRAIDIAVPVENVATVREVVDESLWMIKLATGLLGTFGALALGLASLGLYGVTAYSVAQRRREIGVRMALGADRLTVVREILAQTLALVAIGLLLGIGVALFASRSLASILFGLSPTDLVSYGAAATCLGAVSFVASYLPAWRASRVAPSLALRGG